MLTKCISVYILYTKKMWYKKIGQKYYYIQRWPSGALSEQHVLPTVPPTNPGMVPNYLIQEQPDSAELYRGCAGPWYWLVQHTAMAGWLCCSNTFQSKKDTLPLFPLHPHLPALCTPLTALLIMLLSLFSH